jgi:hypothetical protein
MQPRLRRQRGTAAIEMAIVGPLLVLLAIGGMDLGRVNADSTTLASEARAGLRAGVVSVAADMGNVIRLEADPNIPNTAATWGAAAPGGVEDCSIAATSCGDPGGCAIGSAFWTTAGTPIRCFSVNYCTSSGSPKTCGALSTWATHLPAGHGAGVVLVVKVVARYQPLSAMLQPFLSAGYMYSQQTLYGAPLY